MTRSEFLEKYQNEIESEDILLADGFDEAIIGLDYITHRVIYDANKMIQILIKTEEMSLNEAIEHLEYNTWNTHVGDKTPIFLY
jgi:hypothetical protein